MGHLENAEDLCPLGVLDETVLGPPHMLEEGDVTNRGSWLPLIKILSTGGTIATAVKNGEVVILPGKEILQTPPQVRELANIDVEDVAKVSSCNMNPDIWLKLSKRMNEVLVNPDVAGAIITHGTDTLEETAYFLDLTLTTHKPVVVFGSMRRPLEHPDADGPRNLLNAVRVVISPEASKMGVMVVMNGKINGARDVAETNTSAIETFQSLEFGPLGIVDVDGKVRFHRFPMRRQTIALDEGTKLGRVEIVVSYAGADGRVIRGLLSQGPLDGLVIGGTGSGNVSELMYDAIRELRNQGVPIVMSTRVYSGRVRPLFGSLGTSATLKEIGCVLADNLTPQKARILLMLALTKTKDSKDLQRYFEY